MTDYHETFADCEIVITNDSVLTINGKLIEYYFNDTNQSWYSKYLPYSNFDSLKELARAIARDSVEFSTSIE